MSPVHRPFVRLAGLLGLWFGLGLVLVLAPGVGVGGSAGGSVRAATTPTVHTVLGPGVVSAPGGLALDAAGNLFVADTGHCRVLVVPARAGSLDGLRLRPGHPTVLAGSRCGAVGGIGAPSDVAVDGKDDVYIAEATAERVQKLPAGTHHVVTVAGTGEGGFENAQQIATSSQLDQPTGVAVDAAGDLYIADTANCMVRVLPAAGTTTFDGQPVAAGHLVTVAGTGVCGSQGQGGPVRTAQIWNPVAVALDAAGDLLIADNGDQSVLLAPAGAAASFAGTTVGAGDIGVVVGGTGSYGPYVADGLPANGPTAELNDLRGLAVGPDGVLVMTDGFMHVIRAVPASDETVFGKAMKSGDLYTIAGALPVSTPAGDNDGTRWVVTKMGTPVGVAVAPSRSLYFSDASANTVRMLPGPGAGWSSEAP